MRGGETFDGKLAGNRQMVDRYNESKGRGKKKRDSLREPLRGGPGTQPGALPKGEGGESGGARERGGHDEIKQVVDEHGPAHSHTIMRSPQGYHSLTHHEDGHVHHEDHATLEEAQEHGAHAFDDAEHMDMPKEDYETAEEERGLEEHPNTGTSRVGFMS